MNRGKGRAIQYWRHPFFKFTQGRGELSVAVNMMHVGLLTAIAAILQSAGGYAPGIGFLLSTMATLPIFLATVVSVRYGFLSYLVAIFLLLFIQPSELFIFPFTTGILGLVLGALFHKARFFVVFWSGTALFIGIAALLFVFRFPVLGPGIGSSFDFALLLVMAAFSLLYGWAAAEACAYVLKRLVRIIQPVSGRRE